MARFCRREIDPAGGDLFDLLLCGPPGEVRLIMLG
jgi:hypothetical protein